MKKELYLELNKSSKVLLIGNGLLQLVNKNSWKELLKKISEKEELPDLDSIPSAMQPEVLCSLDTDGIQDKIDEVMDETSTPHEILVELLRLPFDAIITTNYTYEIETVLSDGSWNEGKRKKAFTTLYGSNHVQNNTFICNIVETADGKSIPVFHIHGEKARKRSMILSYYSYAGSLARLVEYNKKVLKNRLKEHQDDDKPFKSSCWLDYFIMADVFSIGFGFDLSEFDIWWAAERKAREKATHGKLTVFMENTKKESAVVKMLKAMHAECQFHGLNVDDYESMYRGMLESIQKEFEK